MKFIILLSAIVAVALCVEDVKIVRSSSNIDFDGSFKFGYETSDGTSHDAAGNNDGVKGQYAYKSPEGHKIELVYVADAGGFQPQGAHLPVGPQIPPHVLRALEWNRNHPEEDSL